MNRNMNRILKHRILLSLRILKRETWEYIRGHRYKIMV